MKYALGAHIYFPRENHLETFKSKKEENIADYISKILFPVKLLPA